MQVHHLLFTWPGFMQTVSFFRETSLRPIGVVIRYSPLPPTGASRNSARNMETLSHFQHIKNSDFGRFCVFKFFIAFLLINLLKVAVHYAWTPSVFVVRKEGWGGLPINGPTHSWWQFVLKSASVYPYYTLRYLDESFWEVRSSSRMLNLKKKA